MSLSIEIIGAVQECYKGTRSVDDVCRLVQTNREVIDPILTQIASASLRQPNIFGIDYNDHIITLAERLTCIISAPSAVAASHFDTSLIELIGDPLDKADILSCMFRQHNGELTREHFEACTQGYGPVALTVSCYSEGLCSSLQALGATLGPVVSFTIRNTLDEEELLEVIKALPAVKSLKLSQATDEFVEKAAWPETLEELDLSGTSVSAQAVAHLLATCPLLTRLNLRGCEGIIHEELISLPCPDTFTDILYDPYWNSHTSLDALNRVSQESLLSPIAIIMYVQAQLEGTQPEKTKAFRLLEPFCRTHPLIGAHIALIDLLRTGSYGVIQDHAKAKRYAAALKGASTPRMQAMYAREAKIFSLAYAAYKKAPFDDYVIAALAELALDDENEHLARYLAQRAIEINPRNSSAHVTLANLCSVTAADIAQAHYQIALAHNAHDRKALLGLAALILPINTEENSRQAALLLNTLLSLEKNPQAELMLAKLYTRKSMPDEATACFQRALTLDPTNPEIQNEYAEFLRLNSEGQHDTDRAIALFHKAAKPRKKKQRAVATDANAGLAAMKMEETAGRWANRDEALLHAEHALGQSDTPFVREVLGELLLPIDPVRAIAYLEPLVYSADVISIPACAALATYYIPIDIYKAEHFLEIASAHGEEDVRVLIAKAKYLLWKEEYGAAEDCLATIDPQDPEALVLLTMTQLALHKDEDAKKSVENLMQKKFGYTTRVELFALFANYPHFLAGGERAQILKKLCTN